MSLPRFGLLEIHEKGWGCEKWIANTPDYCGKLLCFKEGAKFSRHMHRDKAESFNVLSGVILFGWTDPKDASEHTLRLIQGDVVDIPRMCIHQITALTKATILEVSSHHEDSDSYRVAPGDTQLQAAT